jgi:hypothetical protein
MNAVISFTWVPSRVSTGRRCSRAARALSRVGAIEDFLFGPERSVFKVAGKMFALSAHLPGGWHARVAGNLRRS